MSADFDGKVVIVTGGGSGMGRAMVREFSGRGATVVAVDVNADAAQATIDGLTGPGRAMQADVSSPEQTSALIADVEAGFGRIDVLCNNAGVLDDYTPAADTSIELWNRVIGVDLTGPFLLSRAVIPGMIARGGGAIVNTASVSSFVAGGGGAAYTAAKHGILGLTKQLAFDYGKHNVRVNAVCPGAIQTGMTEYLLTEEGRNPHVDAAIEGTPAGRWGKPEEVAKLAAFLASEDAAFIHGSGYLIDGGWTLP
jgi:3-oxoacyl-[acyl-carrier protein] reductase